MVIVDVALESLPLTVVRSRLQLDQAYLEIQLPQDFSPAAFAACALDVLSLSTSQQTRALPSGTVCNVRNNLVQFELAATLEEGTAYRFGLAVANPLVVLQSTVWTFRTYLNGQVLHTGEHPGFAVAETSSVSLQFTSMAASVTHRSLITLATDVDMGGSWAILIDAPGSFRAMCSEPGDFLRGSLPAEATCEGGDGSVRLVLPAPASLRPYAPVIGAGFPYVFSVLIANPANISGDNEGFRVQYYTAASALTPSRFVGLRVTDPPPALGQAADDTAFQVVHTDLRRGIPNQLDIFVTVPSEADNVYGLRLQVPFGFTVAESAGAPCQGFIGSCCASQGGPPPGFEPPFEVLDLQRVLCAAVSQTTVFIQTGLEPLQADVTYAFQLEITNPAEFAILVDVFSLVLTGADERDVLFASSIPGFATEIEQLEPIVGPNLQLASVQLVEEVVVAAESVQQKSGSIALHLSALVCLVFGTWFLP